jgi:hypothetical protein
LAAWSYPLYGPKASTSRLGVEEGRICLPLPPTRLNLHIQWQAGLSFCVTPSVITIPCRYRNINLLSIDYAFRPRLRDRLTLSGLTFLRKP